jgi:hypothetical protein
LRRDDRWATAEPRERPPCGIERAFMMSRRVSLPDFSRGRYFIRVAARMGAREVRRSMTCDDAVTIGFAPECVSEWHVVEGRAPLGVFPLGFGAPRMRESIRKRFQG